MGIDFSPARWDLVKRNYTAWWDGTLGRPLIPVWVGDRDPGRPEPSAPVLAYANCADFRYSAEELIDRMDYEISGYSFWGDAFPLLRMTQFGPGILAGFLGAKLVPKEDTVWFFPEKVLPIEELHFSFTEDNVWLQRIADIYRAGKKRWAGQVCMEMTDLGGALDTLSVFRPGELLLYDLYDAPDEVDRLENELLDIWLRCYDYFADIIGRENGFCDWSEIWSPTPSYIFQSDISYMLSPEMFDRFALPRLKRGFEAMGHSIYHLDGIGQIPDLPTMLAQEKLDVLQWVPGDGQKPQGEWEDIYRAIGTSGKKTQVFHGIDSFRKIGRWMGGFEKIHMPRIMLRPEEWPLHKALLDEFGVPTMN